MPLDDVYASLTLLLRELFDDDSLSALPNLTADQVKGWDSLAQVRLILTVERQFAISFSAREVAELDNIGQLAALIAAKAT